MKRHNKLNDVFGTGTGTNQNTTIDSGENHRWTVIRKNKKRRSAGLVAAFALSIMGLGVVAGCSSSEKADSEVAVTEVQEQTEKKPPEITQEEVSVLFPGYEIVDQQTALINGFYYTVLAIGLHETEFDASVKVAIVDYDGESEEQPWTTVWETEDYFADPMFDVTDFLGELFVLEDADAPIALVGFNMLHGGSMAIYDTTILEVNDQGIGKVAWEGHGSRIEKQENSFVVYDLGETHFSIDKGQFAMKEIGRSDLAPADAYQASFTINNDLVVPTHSKDLYLELGETLSFVPEDEEARKSFDAGEIMIYTNLWNEGPVTLANANMMYGGNAIEMNREGKIEFVLDYYSEENPTSLENPPITFVVHVGEGKDSSE